LPSPKRDHVAAKGFLQPALWQAGQFRPRVLNVDVHPASAIEQPKRSGELGQRCRSRRAPYLNNIREQDHRFVKKRIMAGQFRSVDGARNTIAGYEAMNIIRTGQIRRVAKNDILGFIERTFGIVV
jgi:transposase-like protein